MNSISGFRRDLENKNIIDKDNWPEDDELTHSHKMLMELNHYFQYGKQIALFIAYYLEVDKFFVINNKNHDGVIFVGHAHNIYATIILFECIRG
jgi:hypothetical protein